MYVITETTSATDVDDTFTLDVQVTTEDQLRGVEAPCSTNDGCAASCASSCASRG
ncbi:FxLD family lanthipeptide [Fodinicola acaciae]|uniref:FxLD family lanthipeptide n=1 Tax=Fodinicola acaciae TaxID=2681555 RepID=UPI0013D4BD4E